MSEAGLHAMLLGLLWCAVFWLALLVGLLEVIA